MPELKSLGRQIAQPSAPDLSGAADVYTGLGNIVTKAAQTVGEYVQANNTLIEKSVVAKANNDFETSYINYKNNPNISMDTLAQFQQELQAQTEGLLQAVPQGREKSAAASLSSLVNDYSNKALNDTLQQAQKNEMRDLSLAMYDIENAYTNQISQGDKAGALETQVNFEQTLQAMAQRGASAKEITSLIKNMKVSGITAEINKTLKEAPTESHRVEVMKYWLSTLDDSPENMTAINAGWKEFTRLNKLYAEADAASPIIQNSMSGYAYANRNAPKDIANKLVRGVANTMQNKEQEAQETGRPLPGKIQYQATPVFKGQEKTFDFNEESAAIQEGRPQNFYAVEATAETLEAPRIGQPELFKLAKAHAYIGSKNSTEFPDAVGNILHGGSGQLMNDAVTAINDVFETNPGSLELDSETEALYQEFKSLRDTGRTDYDEMRKQVLSTINTAKKEIDINTKIFDHKYANIDNLNKEFKKATGVDAIKTGSTVALREFGRIYKSKFLQSANFQNALEMANRDISRVAAEDNFTGGQYVNFAPTKMLQGMNDTQIGNLFILQLVNFADKNKNFVMEENYKAIKDASDYDRALVHYASSVKLTEKEEGERNVPVKYSNSNVIRVSQIKPGEGVINGTFFAKPTSLTAQNNLGIPVWEAWMIDDLGRPFPIIDDTSPSNNTLLIYGRSLQEFAPEYTKNQSQEKIDDIIEQQLYDEGRAIYGIKSYIPYTAARASKKSYVKDLENIKRVSKKVGKQFGLKETEGETP